MRPHQSRSVVLSLTLGAVMLAAASASRAQEGQPCQHAAAQAAKQGAARPTEEFRAHHAQIREHLRHLDAMAMSLRSQAPDEQRRTMQRMHEFLTGHIGPHAADEERVLYPVVARRVGDGSLLTAVPIYEHRIVERLIESLGDRLADAQPDADAFALEALHLTGLLHAHFEVEEDVLLPVLDRTMTADAFKRDVADKMPH